MRQNLARISPKMRHNFFGKDQFPCNDWACLVFPNHLERCGTNLERLEQLKHPGDSPEIRQRSFAALRMTKPQAVTLSAAKGLARRTERSFAALRMTCRTPLKSSHRIVLSPNICHPCTKGEQKNAYVLQYLDQ